jgi:hypothetical protein
MHKVLKQQLLHFSLFVLLTSAIASLAPDQPLNELPLTQFPSAWASVAEKPGPIKGWHTVMWYPDKQYEYGISDKVFYKDQKCAFIRSATGEPYGPYMFGELSQAFKAKRYRNKRMRFSAVIKSDVIDMSAALFMTVEGPGHQWISYDDMNGRNITGTRDWERYKVVLDVPEESDYISFGIRVSRNGEVWISSITFDETTDDTTADPLYADKPSNLDFSS